MRSIIRALIEQDPSYGVCAEAPDGAAAVQLAGTESPDLAVVDISLPSSSGIEVTKLLQELRPEMPILILSMHNEGLYAKQALRAGAMGYLMKHEAAEKIHEALLSIREGRIYASERVMAEIRS
ncbi:MAG: two component transcriptional regulator, LuxR family [Verrucomicrobia bacterium]|nr:two component transcriptional regulator, LuxR family [Verrucomicrobiota bacterium]